jgi:hypothetical protein
MEHARRIVRSGQLRFRLETFGVYYPSRPYSRPWWRMSARGLWLLARQAPSYLRWVIEMERLRAGTGERWWEEHGGSPREPEE